MPLNPKFRSQQKRQEALVKRNAPKRKRCPKCNHMRGIGKFGTRTQHDKSGKPIRAMLQSYCVYCRSGTSTPKTKTKRASKASTNARARRR